MPVTAQIEEGMEWSDGFFAYIAYRKSDGTMVVRDIEGFDYSMDDWSKVVTAPDVKRVYDQLENAEHIKRWEGEVGPLPR